MVTSQQIIIGLLRRELQLALMDHIRCASAAAAALAGSKAWQDMNPDDGVGGFSTNPYSVDSAVERETESRNRLDSIRAAHDFAVDTFISK